MRRLWLGMFITGVVVLVAGAPAGATVTQGSCSGSATFSDGETVTAAQAKATVPKEDTVSWKGSLGVPPSDKEQSYSGGIKAELPLGTVTIRSWGGTTKKVADADVDSYTIPDVVPGITFTVKGNHTQGGEVCKAQLEVAIDGGAGPIGAASAALTGASAAGVAFAARGRP